MNIKRILITGSEGNIGSVLCPYLVENRNHILKCDILHKYEDNYIMSDVTNPGDLYKVYDEYSPHVVIHMAAKVSRVDCEKSPNLTVQTNLSGLQNIIQLCLRNKAKLIYFSTSEVYGNISGLMSESRTDLAPNNIYGLTKLSGENLVKYYSENYGLKAIVVRPFMIYNENQVGGKDKAAINRFIYDILNGKRIHVHKNSVRSWLHISDFVKAIEKCIDFDVNYEVINIGHPTPIKTEELASVICSKLGVNYSDFVIEEDLPKMMTLDKCPDLTKQTELLGFKPEVNILDGIDLIINKAKQKINGQN